ncbi:YraN family protein [Robiginitalea myxolifaciens]|nr:YraN family protein [Robiginitalea myxolifaciens]
METTTQLGDKGEEIAAEHLSALGYQILERKYRYRHAEIDLIVQRRDLLVIVEVKTRSGSFYEAPVITIPKLKMLRLIRAADHYIRSYSGNYEVRFDVIYIEFQGKHQYRIRHTEDAFYFF